MPRSGSRVRVPFSALFSLKAQMAELVDALVSGTSNRKVVQVRVLFWAQNQKIVPLGADDEIGIHATLRG